MLTDLLKNKGWSYEDLRRDYCASATQLCQNNLPLTELDQALFLCECDESSNVSSFVLLCGCRDCQATVPDKWGKCLRACSESDDDWGLDDDEELRRLN